MRKSLYGLKQAPRAWYSKMDAFLISQNFERCKSNWNVYLKKKEGLFRLFVLYVDELLITSSSAAGLKSIKSNLNKAFTMTDLGLLRQFIGLEVSQNTSRIMISPSRYSSNMLRRFHIEECKENSCPFLSGIRLEEGVSTPLVYHTRYRQLIGILL